MSLFPRRQSVAEFLEETKFLEPSPDENDPGEDLLEEDGEEEDEEEEEEEEEEANHDEAVSNSDHQHRAFDAVLRQKEDVALKALARRFEERAAAYEAYGDGECVDAVVLDQRSTALKIAAARAKQEARQSAAEVAKAQAEEEEKRKARHAALNALYELYDDDEKQLAKDLPKAGTQQTSEEKEEESVGGAARKRKVEEEKRQGVQPRYRIKKKSKAN